MGRAKDSRSVRVVTLVRRGWVRWGVLGGVEVELELVGSAHVRGEVAFLTDRWGELKTRGPYGWLLLFVGGGYGGVFSGELELVGGAHVRGGVVFLTDRWGELKTRGPYGWLRLFVGGGYGGVFSGESRLSWNWLGVLIGGRGCLSDGPVGRAKDSRSVRVVTLVRRGWGLLGWRGRRLLCARRRFRIFRSGVRHLCSKTRCG